MSPRSPKVVRKARRDDTEISRCIKYEKLFKKKSFHFLCLLIRYLMFGFNILFWVKKKSFFFFSK